MAALYYQISPSTLSDYSVTDEPELPGDIEFIDGTKIDEPLPNPLEFTVDYPSRGELPHFVGMTIPVMSDSLVKVFRSAGVENFQTFPAVLRNPEIGEEWGGYWAFNVIGLIAAANLEKSKADTIMEGDSEGVAVPLLGFHTLVLDKKKTRNSAMFRLAESSSILLVHDRVLAHIKKNRPKNGWGFEATEIETV
jgi:hypothetical protein